MTNQDLLEDKALLYSIILLVALCAVIYLLYSQGIAISKSIAAIIFVFRPGRNADRVTVDSCTGWVKHVGRFHKRRTYEFFFDAQLSKGDVEVILSDQEEQQLIKLDQQSPTCKIDIDAENKYYLRWEFKSATGKCELRWSAGENT